MTYLIEPVQVPIVDYSHDASHKFVAGVQFSLWGYGGCSIAVADKTDRTLITVIHLAKPEDSRQEERFIRDVFSKWNITSWRYLSERQQESQLRSLNYLGDEPITYNDRAGQIQDATGVRKAYPYRIDYRNRGGDWYPVLEKEIELIKGGKFKIADPRFRSGLCSIRYEQNSIGVVKITFPPKEAHLIYAGILALIEIDDPHFEVKRDSVWFEF